MVNTQHVNGDIVSTHLNSAQTADKSITRVFKQLFYLPWRTNYYFDSASRILITQAVREAEKGNTGEVQVVVEGCLPLSTAYRQNTLWRARELFGTLGVWDTALNSGVLLYVNICERRVEIVADRGINANVSDAQWQTVCATVTADLSSGAFSSGVVRGVNLIGQILTEFHQSHDVDVGNELGDAALFL